MKMAISQPIGGGKMVTTLDDGMTMKIQKKLRTCNHGTRWFLVWKHMIRIETNFSSAEKGLV